MINALFYKIRKNQYFYFILKLFALFIIVFIIDYAVGGVLRKFYFRQHVGVLYRTTYSMETTTADLLIFGSSRASHHYQPEVCERRLKMNYYNTGRDGNYIFYYYAMIKSILKRYSPKIIILDLTTKDLIVNEESYDRIASLLPYYETHPEIRSVVSYKSKFEKIKLLSRIYPYNSAIFTIANGNMGLSKREGMDIKGYIPFHRSLNQAAKPGEPDYTAELDTVKIQIYESFIKECINSGIKLYIVTSPIYVNYSEPDMGIETGKRIAAKYNIPFYDYINDQEFLNNPTLFYDKSHLNDEGAKVFTEKLLDKICKNDSLSNAMLQVK